MGPVSKLFLYTFLNEKFILLQLTRNMLQVYNRILPIRHFKETEDRGLDTKY